MLLLYTFLILQICLASGNVGLLRIKTSPNGSPTDVCTSYNPVVTTFLKDVSLISWDEWNKVVDIYPSTGCNASQNSYQKNYVLLKRGNCTFAKKTTTVLEENGAGVIVVSDTLDTPGFDSNFSDQYSNVTVALIDEETYFLIKNLQKEFGMNNVRILEYSPVIPSSVDLNIIAIWLIAVLTLAYGAWMQGSQKLEKLANETQHTTPAPSGSSKETSNSDLGEISLTITQVVIFFVVCSVSILFLYFFYDYIVYIIIGLFCYATTFAMFDLLYNLLKRSPWFVRLRVPKINVPLLRKRPPICGFILFAACASLSITWAIFRKEPYAWVVQDILGCSFCIFMIKTIQLNSFKISTILLMLFFVYDVFYVFITPFLTKNNESIMVKIATGGPGEMKEQLPLLFKIPKFFPTFVDLCFERTYSLLGYGDVVLPGLHVGFCAVWDVITGNQQSVKRHYYYISAMLGYCAGLGFTFLAVELTNLGQPALLYLAPSVLLSTLFVAIKQKELRNVWAGKIIPNPNTENPDTQLHESHSLLAITH